MSERKVSEGILNNGNIELQNSNVDTKVTIEKDEVEIEIVDSETKVFYIDDAIKGLGKINVDNLGNTYKEIKDIDFNDAKEEIGERNKNNKDKDAEKDYLVMAYAVARPDGLLVGRTPQPQNQTSSGDSPPPAPRQQSSPSRTEGEDNISISHRVIMVYTPERNRFIKCILTSVFIMLLMTAAFLAFIFALPDVKEWFRINTLLLIFPILVFIMSVNYVMSWRLPCTRRQPGNIICLILTVVSMSLLSAVLTSYYSTDIILYAFIATTVVVFFCIILACSNFDFTSYLLYLIVILVAFFVLASIIIFIVLVTHVPLNPTFVALLIAGTLLQVIMLTINLQMIIGGKTIEMSEDDYALAAYMVYMAIIDIFLKMVYIIGLSRDM